MKTFFYLPHKTLKSKFLPNLISVAVIASTVSLGKNSETWKRNSWEQKLCKTKTAEFCKKMKTFFLLCETSLLSCLCCLTAVRTSLPNSSHDFIPTAKLQEKFSRNRVLTARDSSDQHFLQELKTVTNIPHSELVGCPREGLCIGGRLGRWHFFGSKRHHGYVNAERSGAPKATKLNCDVFLRSSKIS